MSNSLPYDIRAEQVFRCADFLESCGIAGATIPEINTACDPGCTTKVLSVMRRDLGYVIRRERITVVCASGTSRRGRYRFILVSRPSETQRDLFNQK